MAAFQSGLREAGFIDKQTVRIEARFADGHFDLLPQLTTDLVQQRIDVFVATGGRVTVVKAKPIVPASIPIVFAMGGDPVKLGVVASLNKPGDNITGVTFLVNGLAAKCVELLHDLAPHAEVIGLLVNPRDPNAKPDTQDAQAAAGTFGQRLVLGEASGLSRMETETADYFRQKPAQCRRLAGAVVNQNDPVVANLLAMAVEFEAKAVALSREEASAKQIEQTLPET